ncbi:DeoR family transcriptional regulator [Clostridium beijerinckii]|uniref:DeoR family transcriptional regulator n=1 Tax=Clostridium beijerinckii TaxID=1520 RepID=A0A0B5QJ86_CLOBE|nr:DeoR/GlpR family DNA-binding transcription regulator [Clostridium beijerinckii]AJG98261.1 DeoR family transcriptional regulator [Clostridium beijerinckii]
MFREERHKHILDLLNKYGKVLVKDLELQFRVGKSMIRKDLQSLEKENLLKRTYGGAIKKEWITINEENLLKLEGNRDELKKNIAEKVCKQINEYDRIFLDASSISSIIVKLLLKSNKKITLITNMVTIASMIPKHSQIHIIFIGGDYNPIVGGNIGTYAVEQIKLYRCNKAFIGCSGIDLIDGGISASMSEDANAKKIILSIAKESYLMVLNEGFNQNGTFIFSNIVDFDGIITEVLPDNAIINSLKKYNVDLL